MWRRFGFLVRRDERRPVAVAFAFLFVLVSSHTALESARDGLFLAKLSGDRLPIVYVGIALLSYAATKLRDVGGLSSRRLEVSIYAAGAGLTTAALGAALPALGDLGLYALYVSSGVSTATVLVSFWAVLGDVFTATQAKRVYGLIGLGAMIGGVTGSAAVGLVAPFVSPRAVVFLAAAGFVLASLLPRMLPGRAEVARSSFFQPTTDPLFSRLREDVKYATRGPYVWRLLGIATAASATVTLLDFVFKSTMAAELPASELTGAFARTYFVLNVLALGVQLLTAGTLARRLSPSTLLAILPGVLLLSGGALALTGGLVAAIVAKATDGALRHGAYKTGLELSALPLSDEARRKVKAALEIVGQRGGQLLASAAIVLVSTLAGGLRVAAVLLVGLSALWLVLSVRLHRYYVEQFRGSIAAGARHAPAALDVASLETLVATLDSDAPKEVVAAMSLLEREKKGHLVPALILFHPSEDVVVAALRLFARARRRVAPHALEVLLGHTSARLRAEAYAAQAVIDPAAEGLGEALEREGSVEARAAIVTSMTASGALLAEDGKRMLEALLEDASSAAKVVVAETIGWRKIEALEDLVIGLAGGGEAPVRFAAVRALGELATPRACDTLVGLLVDEVAQQRARSALAHAGAPAFDALARALVDVGRPPVLRWALPRSLTQLDPERGAALLLDNLRIEADGMVRYRSLIALGHVVARAPAIELSRARLQQLLREDLSRAYRTLDRRLVLEAGVKAEPSRATPGHGLLVDVLRDKEKSALGRIFRLLGLAHPEHDFGAIFRSLENGERPRRAGAVELTGNLLRGAEREAVLGLIDEIDDEARLAFGAEYHAPILRDYEAILKRLLRSRSGVLRDLAAYHASELGAESMLEPLQEIARGQHGSGEVERAIEVLTGARSLRRGALPGALRESHHVG